jgi:transcriptional regulator
MYMPKHFEHKDQADLLEVMRTYDFALMISNIDGVPFATHLPALVRETEAGLVIDAHVAAANPHWRGLEKSPEVLIVFSGPHSYVSPTLYASFQRVPTWNYLAVHAMGVARVMHDAADKEVTLARLIAHHEPEFAARFAQFETGMRDSLLKGIVALEIRVTSLEGKLKLGQHRLHDDRAEMQSTFENGDENQRALASWMKKLGYWK